MVEWFKNTEVGIIPEDWEVKAIDKEIDFITGFPFQSAKFVKNGVRLLRGSNVKRGVTDWSDDNTKFWEDVSYELKQYLLKEGDVVIAMDGSLVGKSFARITKNDLPALLVQRIARVRSNKIDEGYLKEFICSDYFTKHCDNVKTASAIPHISPKDIRSFHIPLPPTKAEQTAIAIALNDADALITQLEKLIAKKKAIKQGAMLELLKPKEGWKTKMFRDFLCYEQPIKYIVEDTKYDDHNQIPVLTAGKSFILGYTNEEFGVFDNLPVIIFDDFTTASKFIDFKFKVKSSAMKILKPIPGMNLRFIYELMQTIDFDSTDHKRYWISEYQNIEIKVPSPSEQKKISDILSDMNNEIEKLEDKLEKQKQLKQGIMQNLLTGKIRLV